MAAVENYAQIYAHWPDGRFWVGSVRDDGDGLVAAWAEGLGGGAWVDPSSREVGRMACATVLEGVKLLIGLRQLEMIRRFPLCGPPHIYDAALCPTGDPDTMRALLTERYRTITECQNTMDLIRAEDAALRAALASRTTRYLSRLRLHVRLLALKVKDRRLMRLDSQNSQKTWRPR